MITPFMNLSSVTNPKVGFYVSYAPLNAIASDTLEVLITTDGGYNYTSVYKKWGSALQTASATTASYTPSSQSDWRYEIIDLTPYQSALNAQLAFRNISKKQNNLYVDEILVDQMTGVQNVEGVNSFSVYPNPNAGQFTINAAFDRSVDAQLIIANALGQVIYIKEINNSSFINLPVDLTGFAKGIYNVVVKTDKGLLNSKISFQ